MGGFAEQPPALWLGPRLPDPSRGPGAAFTGIADRSLTGSAGGPIGPLPDLVLTAEIRAVLAASPFQGKGHQKAWARHPFVIVRAEWIKASVGALIEIR